MELTMHSKCEEQCKMDRARREGKSEFHYLDDERNIHKRGSEPRITVTTTLPVELHQRMKEHGLKWNDFMLYGLLYIENKHKYDFYEKELQSARKEIEELKKKDFVSIPK